MNAPARFTRDYAANLTSRPAPVQHQVYRLTNGGGTGITVCCGTWDQCMEWMAAHRADGRNYYLRVAK